MKLLKLAVLVLQLYSEKSVEMELELGLLMHHSQNQKEPHHPEEEDGGDRRG